MIQVCGRRESSKKVFSVEDERFSLWKTSGCVEDKRLCGRREVLWKTREAARKE